MLNYTDELYAKFGRKYIPTGRTGADWDRMEKALRDLVAALRIDERSSISRAVDIDDAIRQAELALGTEAAK